MYMNDGTRPCINAQINNDGGEKAAHFWGKHNSLPETLFLTLIQKTARTDGSIEAKQIPLYFYGAEKHGIQPY